MTPFQDILKSPYFAKWYPLWVRNGQVNYQTIYGDFRRGNACVSAIPRGDGKPAIVIGSGASLDEAAPYLKDWKYPIFCGPTNALAIEANGAHPTYLHAYDSHESNARRLAYKWDYSITQLVIHPSSSPRILNTWKGRRWYFLRMFDGHEYFEFIQPMMWYKLYEDRGISVIFPFRGCVVNNEMAIAAYLGFSPIFAVGCDFGWKDPKRTRCINYSPDARGKLQPIYPTPEDELGGDINTDPYGVRYYGKDDNFKKHFLDLIGPLSTDVFDCSDGMVRELKKANIKEVIEKQGEGYFYTPEEKKVMQKTIIEYLTKEKK